LGRGTWQPFDELALGEGPLFQGSSIFSLPRKYKAITMPIHVAGTNLARRFTLAVAA
jgi:hypothetical protein